MKEIKNILDFSVGHRHAHNFRDLSGKTFYNISVISCAGPEVR